MTPTQLDAEQFTFLVDTETRDEPVIGFQITTRDNSFLVPMSLETAEQIGTLMLNHVTLYRKASTRV